MSLSSPGVWPRASTFTDPFEPGSTAKLFTAAALLISVVFLSFATSRVSFIKLFGLPVKVELSAPARGAFLAQVLEPLHAALVARAPRLDAIRPRGIRQRRQRHHQHHRLAGQHLGILLVIGQRPCGRQRVIAA